MTQIHSNILVRYKSYVLPRILTSLNGGHFWLSFLGMSVQTNIFNCMHYMVHYTYDTLCYCFSSVFMLSLQNMFRWFRDVANFTGYLTTEYVFYMSWYVKGVHYISHTFFEYNHDNRTKNLSHVILSWLYTKKISDMHTLCIPRQI